MILKRIAFRKTWSMVLIALMFCFLIQGFGAAVSKAHAAVGSKTMVGYWHNSDNGSGFIRLRDVSPKFDVVNVAFAEPAAGATNGTIGFTPYNYTEADFKADVAYLQSQGKKVLISIGGANGRCSLQARKPAIISWLPSRQSSKNTALTDWTSILKAIRFI
ncbi:Chitinase D precursor [Paenibacillus sp. P1XP2]|nr:Chitinase D precursor [Paenibacillus sp. P1XP2]